VDGDGKVAGVTSYERLRTAIQHAESGNGNGQVSAAAEAEAEGMVSS
jgi:hypothetical protein